MIEAAKVLSALAVILALASLRYRHAMKAAWACAGGVALCLIGELFH